MQPRLLRVLERWRRVSVTRAEMPAHEAFEPAPRDRLAYQHGVAAGAVRDLLQWFGLSRCRDEEERARRFGVTVVLRDVLLEQPRGFLRGARDQHAAVQRSEHRLVQPSAEDVSVHDDHGLAHSFVLPFASSDKRPMQRPCQAMMMMSLASSAGRPVKSAIATRAAPPWPSMSNHSRPVSVS